ncbi:MAG: hypothetical protein ABIJ09_06330 [Pseudomonadota bacterium]
MSLLVLGFTTLFLELALIRFLSASVWNLGYFPNFVLMAVFIGMGLGFVLNRRLSDRSSVLVYEGTSLLMLGIIALAIFFRPQVPGFGPNEGLIAGEVFFSDDRTNDGGLGYLFLAVTFVFVMLTAAAVSQRTARLFRQFSPLLAYSLDISGAILGILVFSLMSWAQLPAWGWFLVVSSTFLAAAPKTPAWRRGTAATLLVAMVYLASLSDRHPLCVPEQAETFQSWWSPYQRLDLVVVPPQPLAVCANGIAHQVLLPGDKLKGSIYDAPHRAHAAAHLPPYRRVLIIGGGTGNDAAAALMHGAEHIDVVEIDPQIAAIGKAAHPEKPYSDPRVHLIINDGRNFIERTENQYDLIVFALTDSVLKVSAHSQLRLENYLFTLESITGAYSRLSSDGDLILCNFYRQAWLVQKLLAMVSVATGRTPHIVMQSHDFVMISGSPSAAPYRGPEFDKDQLPVDDWPFLYLKQRAVPGFYLGVLSALALFVAAMIWIAHRWARRDQSQSHAATSIWLKVTFLAMGMAFMLLETKSVVQFSLLFGTTWINSLLVFLGVLVSVLIANWCAHVLREKRIWWPVFGALILACLLPLAFPLSALLNVQSDTWRVLVASMLTFAPIFFANLLFGAVFARQPAAESLFGWNLIGSTLGGLLEYASMATGYSFLAVLVALLYCLAFLALMLDGRREGALSSG